MITIEQCRAARGLLGWTQQDLADASGLSKTAINNFEKGHSDIKAESLRAIRMAFESADVEFLGDQGLSKRADHVEFLKGPDALSDLLDDIFATLKEGGGEVLITSIQEEKGLEAKSRKILQKLERLKTHNVTEKILCCEGTENLWRSFDSCRCAPKDSIHGSMNSFIYGPKVAFELWDRSIIVIMNSPDAAQAEKGRFEYLWANAGIPDDCSNSGDTRQAV